MLHINKLLPAGHGLAPALLRRAGVVALDWDTRRKSRFDAQDSLGRALGVFLPRGTAVRGGDVLVAEDGSLVRVVAQPQAVMRIAVRAGHGTPFDLLRAAYHLGNRHVQIELTPDHLQIEPDHVLAEMLRTMHLDVSEQLAPFEPEGGAYAAGHDPAHGQHAPVTTQAHVHGPGCGHDHGHVHGHAHDPSHKH